MAPTYDEFDEFDEFIALTYDEFIAQVGGACKFQKCLNNELTHFGFTYKLGLNEDTIPFNASGSCQSGGLYFTTSEYIHDFYGYGLNIANIKLCEDALFYIEPEGNKFKTNKFYIDEILPQTEEFYKIAVQQDGRALEFVKEQTPELCKLAVQENGLALRFVKEQTEEICKLAVQENGMAILFVKEQTEEICKIAVQQNGALLQYVKKEYRHLFEKK